MMRHYIDSALFVAGRLGLALLLVAAAALTWLAVIAVAVAAVIYPWHVVPPIVLAAVFVWCRTLDVSPRRPLLLAGVAVWAGVAIAMFTGMAS